MNLKSIIEKHIVLEQTYEYASTQVDITDDVFIEKLLNFKNTNINQNNIVEDEPNVHITIKYGLHTNNHKEVEDVIRRYWNKKTITCSLDKITLFKNDNDVVKIDIISDDLHEMYNILHENLKNTTTFPEYKPHLTLAYVKKDSCDSLINNETFKNIKFVFDSIIFSTKDNKQIEIKLF